MIQELFQTFDDRSAAVRARGLHKSFGTQRALDGLEMTVPEGAVYILVGPNGAGKTTTLRALLDLTVMDEGSPKTSARPWIGLPRPRRCWTASTSLLFETTCEAASRRRRESRLRSA